jgi:hypothetical protein
VKKGTQARSSQKPINKAIDSAQEKGLMRWIGIGQLHHWNMPPKPRLIEAWANRSLASARKPDQVSKIWVHRFIKRLPSDLELGLVKRLTKESRRIQAGDTGLLLRSGMWLPGP